MIILLIMNVICQIDVSIMSGLSISNNSVEYGLTREIDFNQPSSGSVVNLQSGYLFASGIRVGIDFCNMLSPFEWKAESDNFQRTGEIEEGNLVVICSYLFEIGHFRPYAGGGAGTHWGSYKYTYSTDSTLLENTDGLNYTLGLSLLCGMEVDILPPLMLNCRVSYNHVPRTNFPGWLVEEVNHMNRTDFLIGVGIRPW